MRESREIQSHLERNLSQAMSGEYVRLLPLALTCMLLAPRDKLESSVFEFMVDSLPKPREGTPLGDAKHPSDPKLQGVTPWGHHTQVKGALSPVLWRDNLGQRIPLNAHMNLSQT